MSKSKKKTVSVKFSGNDEIVDHIIPNQSVNERKTIIKKIKSKQFSKSIDPDDDFMDEEEFQKAKEAFKTSEILHQEGELIGSDVFGFQTPKKCRSMADKANESVQAVTPKSSGAMTPRSILKKTPRKSGSATPNVKIQGTPKVKKKTGAKPMKHRTPYKLSQRNRNVDESESDESEVSDSDAESLESDEEVENYFPQKEGKKTPKKTPKKTESVTIQNADSKIQNKTQTPKKKRGRPKKDVEDIDPSVAENYFEAQSYSHMTSDRTLSRLETPKMDQETLVQALSGVEQRFQEERDELCKEHTDNFRKWMFHLCNGFNLILHGLGSKRNLIEEFRTTLLKDLPHIVVNGYFPSLTIKNILNAVTEDILEHHGNFRSPVEQCHFIKKQFEEDGSPDFYLLINNIDGPMLRPERVQSVLSMLAQIPGFHIVATIDHINAPLIWDQTKSSCFKWLWFDVTTYDPYMEETSYENSLLVTQTGALALSSLTHVMKSLTPNARGIFNLLAKHQLDNTDNQTYQGLAFPDLYHRCREAFLVNSDLTLRAQLIEFTDHKLIKSKKIDGVDFMTIPLDPATLTEFLQSQED